MNSRPRWFEAAIQEGILPATAQLGESTERPLPVIILSALGAWLVAFPLIGSLSALFGGLFEYAGLIVYGLIMLVIAVKVLRDKAPSVFAEQLAFPLLLAGISALGVGLSQKLPDRLTAFLLALMCLNLALLLPRIWLRNLLGAGTAGLFLLAMTAGEHRDIPALWLSAHALLLAAIVLNWLPLSMTRRRMAEALLDGWYVCVALALAGASMGITQGVDGFRVLSCTLAVAAVVLLALRWPGMRTWRTLLGACVFVALAWWQIAVGPLLLVASICARETRWIAAGAAALGALAAVGTSYYQLQWPLTEKAAVLGAAGALLMLLGVYRPGGRLRLLPSVALGIAGAATLAVLHLSIRDKEHLIAEGAPVFIALQPVDPRSLVQGDYMRLEFLPLADATSMDAQSRPVLVGKVNAQGLLEATRVSLGKDLQPGETGIALTWRRNRWTVVTDAWFFKEGQGEHFAKARYGEFRVTADGRALLVGMRDARLQAL